jgi:hypothetical protein
MVTEAHVGLGGCATVVLVVLVLWMVTGLKSGCDERFHCGEPPPSCEQLRREYVGTAMLCGYQCKGERYGETLKECLRRCPERKLQSLIDGGVFFKNEKKWRIEERRKCFKFQPEGETEV